MAIKTGEVYNLLGLAYRAGKVVWGYNAVMAALNNSNVYLLILAVDSSPGLKAKFLATSQEYGIQAAVYGRKVTIGKAIGKPPCAVAGITDKNLARAIGQKVQEVGA